MLQALWFKCPDYPNESKFLGIFSTKEKAEKARDSRIASYRSLGTDTNNCVESSYYIDECEIDEPVY